MAAGIEWASFPPHARARSNSPGLSGPSVPLTTKLSVASTSKPWCCSRRAMPRAAEPVTRRHAVGPSVKGCGAAARGAVKITEPGAQTGLLGGVGLDMGTLVRMFDSDVTGSVRREPVRVSGAADDQQVEVSGALDCLAH